MATQKNVAICFYCEKQLRRDRLEHHCNKIHPNLAVKEKGDQSIASFFKIPEKRGKFNENSTTTEEPTSTNFIPPIISCKYFLLGKVRLYQIAQN